MNTYIILIILCYKFCYIKKDHIFKFKIEQAEESSKNLYVEVDGEKIVGLPENRLRSLRKKRF